MKKYYTIGEMAKLNRVPTSTLRYYDKIDLVKPSYIDENNGYRYYSYEDFILLDTIQYLKFFDMSLDEIKNQFDSRTVKTTLALYEKQLLKLKEKISELKAIEDQIIHNISNLNTIDSNNDPELIDMDERYLIVLNDLSGSCDSNEMNAKTLSNIIYENKFHLKGDFIGIKSHEDIQNSKFNTTKSTGNLFTDRPENTDYEIIPKGKYLIYKHKGNFNNIDHTYTYLKKYIDDNNMIFAGDAIEIYAIDYVDTKDSDEYLTIIEIPVEKVSQDT